VSLTVLKCLKDNRAELDRRFGTRMNLNASQANVPSASAHNTSVQYTSRSFRFFSFSTALRAGGGML
jgi:hypothetical protein